MVNYNTNVELFYISTSAFWSFYCLNTHDLNRTSTSSVTSTHITVALGYSSTSCQVAVFTVHVMNSTTRNVSQPNSEVLNSQWFLLKDLKWKSIYFYLCKYSINNLHNSMIMKYIYIYWFISWINKKSFNNIMNIT